MFFNAFLIHQRQMVGCVCKVFLSVTYYIAYNMTIFIPNLTEPVTCPICLYAFIVQELVICSRMSEAACHPVKEERIRRILSHANSTFKFIAREFQVTYFSIRNILIVNLCDFFLRHIFFDFSLFAHFLSYFLYSGNSFFLVGKDFFIGQLRIFSRNINAILSVFIFNCRF